MSSFKEQLHPSWQIALEGHLYLLDEIEEKLSSVSYIPSKENVMRAFATPFESIKVLIIGQDPYPNPEYAMGLAFSVFASAKKLPQSLNNIFKEYASDTGYKFPVNGDLTKWSNEGVMLLNRTLTLNAGESNSHQNIGWKEFTFKCAEALSKRSVVAILWGAHAQELAPLFERNIQSVHPSPLSAYRGFFGSKPFSRTNLLLKDAGVLEINWKL